MLSKALIGTVLFATTIMPASAYSNLYGSYPDFDEVEPTAPYSKDEYSINSYRDEVEEYQRKAEEYVENGNHDINEIRKSQQEAIDKANSVIDEFNSWASSSY